MAGTPLAMGWVAGALTLILAAAMPFVILWIMVREFRNIAAPQSSSGFNPSADALEISDVIAQFDPHTLKRRPVLKTDAMACLHHGRARKIVAAFPARADGYLCETAVDAALVRAHGEMQQLWEELRQGSRVWRILSLILHAVGEDARRQTVVDIGCGVGYVVRWMAAYQPLPAGAALVGMDFNSALIAEARSLAHQEGLQCHFEVGNAFEEQDGGGIYLSNGVLHHFRGDALADFFAAQAKAGARAFIHFDIQYNWLTPFGAWLFHTARMREPLARYDGHLSALRAHPSEVLFAAARRGAPDYRLAHHCRRLKGLPFWHTVHAIAGILPQYCAKLEACLPNGPGFWEWQA